MTTEHPLAGKPRDPALIRKWLAALHAGQARAPKCAAHTRLGCPCRKAARTGSAYCTFHIPLDEALRLDIQRRPHLLRIVAHGGSGKGRIGRLAAQESLAAADRRLLRKAWFHDPRIPGSTLALSPLDEERVRKLLDSKGIDLESLAETGQPATARCVDKLRRSCAIFLRGAIDERTLDKRLVAAIRADRRFFAWVEAEEFTAVFGFPPKRKATGS